METVVEYRPQAYAALEAAVLAALEAGTTRVILELDGVETLDTEALRGLIALLRRTRAAGGELVLRTSRPDVLRTLSVTALDRVFRVVQAEAV
jgi:anti-sigma B factor antagonist